MLYKSAPSSVFVWYPLHYSIFCTVQCSAVSGVREGGNPCNDVLPRLPISSGHFSHRHPRQRHHCHRHHHRRNSHRHYLSSLDKLCQAKRIAANNFNSRNSKERLSEWKSEDMVCTTNFWLTGVRRGRCILKVQSPESTSNCSYKKCILNLECAWLGFQLSCSPFSFNLDTN